MPYAVDITDRALAEVDEAVARIAQSAPQAAANWRSRLLAKVQTLENTPESCPLADEAPHLGMELREMLFGKRSGVWRILFSVDRDRVTVLHVRHAARDRLTAEEL